MTTDTQHRTNAALHATQAALRRGHAAIERARILLAVDREPWERYLAGQLTTDELLATRTDRP